MYNSAFMLILYVMDIDEEKRHEIYKYYIK